MTTPEAKLSLVVRLLINDFKLLTVKFDTFSALKS
jgi:hypothetical protein